MNECTWLCIYSDLIVINEMCFTQFINAVFSE